MTKKIIVYSHGFGVEKDDRGLFTDIVNSMPTAEHILFDYNKVDRDRNELTVLSLTEQKEKLRDILNEVKANHPASEINMICHSLGCVIAALLCPAGINRIIYLAPPFKFDAGRSRNGFSERPGATVDVNGTMSFPRRDDSTTIVDSKLWDNLASFKPADLYNQLADKTKLVVINANQDEVLKEKDHSELSSDIQIINIDANHDFRDNARNGLIQLLISELGL